MASTVKRINFILQYFDKVDFFETAVKLDKKRGCCSYKVKVICPLSNQTSASIFKKIRDRAISTRENTPSQHLLSAHEIPKLSSSY